MPSPFPGMDPFIEDQEWEDFQPSVQCVICEVLAPQLAPRYVARLLRREYREELLTVPQERRETYVVIREPQILEAVTIIETLSPANKRASSDGREQYLSKRDDILASRTNLVELGLLRGGDRLPFAGIASGDYFSVVSPGHRRLRTDVYHWTLRQMLPSIPIPLKKDEPSVTLDLQQVFTTVYDRARYQLSLNYGAKLSTPLSEVDAAWLRERTKAG